MPKIFILYAGSQGKSLDNLSAGLAQYAFHVETGTDLKDTSEYEVVIAVSTVNSWVTSKFREATRVAYSSNKLMLVRFVKLSASKPHPYSQIVENSLVNWTGNDDTDWQALLKRLSLLSGRPGLDQLARIRANSDSYQRERLDTWAITHKNDPLAKRIQAEVIAPAPPNYVPSLEQREKLLKGLAAAIVVALTLGFGWQTYRLNALGYDDTVKRAWAKVDTSDVSELREFYGEYRRTDQGKLASHIIDKAEAKFWARTQERNTIAAYDTYLSRFNADVRPKPQFTKAAAIGKDALIEERREVFSRLQIGLVAMGHLSEVASISDMSPQLRDALTAYRKEDPEAPQIGDWDIVKLSDISSLATRVKVFGRSQMVQYKSKRWAGLNLPQSQELPKGFEQFKRRGGFSGTNSATVYFAADKHEIPAESLILLWELADQNYVDIIITGHDDGDRARLASFRLGEQRAALVKNTLVNFGVRESLISTKSWGATRPAVDIAPNSPSQLNRRVEVTFLAR